MSDFAKYVAKQLEKRARRRKVTWLAVIAALIALAVSYLQCGSGFGLGGGGRGKGSGVGPGSSNEPARCS